MIDVTEKSVNHLIMLLMKLFSYSMRIGEKWEEAIPPLSPEVGETKIKEASLSPALAMG